MKRVISSGGTFYYKIILPVILLICTIALPTAVYFDGSGNHLSVAFFFFLYLLVCTVIFLLIAKKFKKVSIDDNFLYISNYLKEITIPLSNIADVTETKWLRGHPVTIHLNPASEFGNKITFLSKFRFSFKSHPIVEELKELVSLKK